MFIHFNNTWSIVSVTLMKKDGKISMFLFSLKWVMQLKQSFSAMCLEYKIYYFMQFIWINIYEQ